MTGQRQGGARIHARATRVCYAAGMRIVRTITAALVAALAAGQAVPAAANDRIGTMARGDYICELPGDAAGKAGHPQPSENFTIESASRYSSPQGVGTYLMRGKELVMTSGPRHGDRYIEVRNGFLRKLDAQGEPTRLRCVRT